MRLFRRSPDEWTPPYRGECACAVHVDDLLEATVPFAAKFRDEMVGETAPSISDLLEAGALDVNLFQAPGKTLYDEATNRDLGPFQWSVWVGDEARLHYDDDAPRSLDDAIGAQPGIAAVAWEDREIFYVDAPSMCAEGILAAVVKALMDDHVRLR